MKYSTHEHISPLEKKRYVFFEVCRLGITSYRGPSRYVRAADAMVETADEYESSRGKVSKSLEDFKGLPPIPDPIDHIPVRLFRRR